ncbi:MULTISPECIES: helix-turn-helix domain-containing protein [Bacteroides]|uniref:helix-turn-helix domain-containing protein n=1 Tax=Bacteroides TaxID=816 RepID=UPI00202DE3A0|nr:MULTISPECIES: helix-turn-helix domain-containing protein [Bacteroides]MDV6195227.1 helix-turn-helix domain-containing protein [Bacteroides hominis (ex Liu et al. 2022)]
MPENESIHDRITQLVNKFGEGKNTVFASIIGSSEANVRGYRASVMPKYDFLEKIARSFDIDLNWLLTGEGSMLPDNKTSKESKFGGVPDAVPISKPDESILYNMYKDLQAEKKEKEAKIEELHAKMLSMSEEIGRLKAKLGEEESEDHPEGLGPAKNAFTKKHSSPDVDNATSATAQ